MILSTTTNPITKYFTPKECVRIIKEAGFDAYDITVASLINHKDNECDDEASLKNAYDLRSYADSLNIPCNQTHAPASTSYGESEQDEKIFHEVVLSMQISAILGAEIIVVHPNQHLKYADNAEELFNLNMTFYNKLIPYCEKFDIKIAVENMWQYDSSKKVIVHSTCSQVDEFKRYIDTLNSKWITACVDIGHIALVNDNVCEFLKDMGKERICALHVHDNMLKEDNHTLPFNGKLDFNSIAKTLGEIGYGGDFTFEAYGFFKDKPLELIPEAYKYANKVGRYLIKKIHNAKKQ